jgi:hypothetical protein
MDDVHEVGKIQRAIGAFGPTPIATEEFSGSAMPQQSLDWTLKTHGFDFAGLGKNKNGVNP